MNNEKTIEEVRKDLREVCAFSQSETVLDVAVKWIARSVASAVQDADARRAWIAAFTDDYEWGGFKLADALESEWGSGAVNEAHRSVTRVAQSAEQLARIVADAEDETIAVRSESMVEMGRRAAARLGRRGLTFVVDSELCDERAAMVRERST